MDVTSSETIDQVITKALGEEIRHARQELGLSQAQLVELMPSKLHPKTLASYEQGARECTVARFCEITRALNESATDLLERALMRTEVDLQTADIRVDIQALVERTRPEVRTVRDWPKERLVAYHWAKARLAAYPGAKIVRLSGDMLREMAVIFGIPVSDLIDQLFLAAV